MKILRAASAFCRVERSIEESGEIDMASLAHRARSDIPGPGAWPLVGNRPSLVPNRLPYVEELHRRYGNVFSIHAGPMGRLVYLLGPDAAELVLLNRGEVVSNRLA